MKRVRARLTYIWIGVLLLATVVILLLAVPFLTPMSVNYNLGSVEKFLTDEPQREYIEPDLVVFVVNLNGTLVAWDSTSPLPNGCHMQWEKPNYRFVDPCSGGKWCKDGRIADVRFQDAKTLTRYELEVNASGVYLDPLRRVEGEPLAEKWKRTWDVGEMPPDEVYDCR